MGLASPLVGGLVEGIIPVGRGDVTKKPGETESAKGKLVKL